MTQKGQITIPVELRAKLGVVPGDTVRLTLEADGVKVQRVQSTIHSAFGIVTPRNRPEDWTKVRAETEAMMAEDAMKRGQG